MNVSEAMRTRRSMRHYQPRPIERDRLERVLEAGRLAPCARDDQEWKFVVVEDTDTRAQLMRAAKGQGFVGEAPVVIAACAVHTDLVMPCGQPAYPIDVAIALDHISLAAVEEGLGGCWVGAFEEEEVKRTLSIPGDVRVVCMMTLGWPADEPVEKLRKPFAETFVFGKWS